MPTFFERCFFAVANSRLIKHVSRNAATPELDLTLCIERLQSDDPSEMVIALRWLRQMNTPNTARAAERVFALAKHADAKVRTEAEQTRRVLADRHGAPWA